MAAFYPLQSDLLLLRPCQLEARGVPRCVLGHSGGARVRETCRARCARGTGQKGFTYAQYAPSASRPLILGVAA